MRIKDIFALINLPRIEINLRLEKTADNDPFYESAVRHFYREAWAPHPKLLYLARKYQFGYAVCPVPPVFEEYFNRLDSSARGNYRKAVRKGYEFKRFNYNAHLDSIRDIWLSAPVRQGIMPKDMREGNVRPINDPPSRSLYHDYPYFGVFKDGKLAAYAACLISGDLCSLNDLYGHAGHLEGGAVPFAIIEIMREVMKTYPSVKFYGYGTYFGASDSMRRFKRKFLFLPHRATWKLKSSTTEALPATADAAPAKEALTAGFSKK